MHPNYALTTLIAGATALAVGATSFAAPIELTPAGAPNAASNVLPDAGTPTLPSETLPQGLTGPENTFWRREQLTGDWYDFRNQLGYKGVTITPQYIGEVFGNWGGADQGVISDGLFNVALDLDLERITGFWKDATLHANALYIYGTSLSSRYVGDFSNTSNIAGYNSLRLQELWLQQNFWEKRFSIRVGMLAADTEFFTSDSAGLFINGTFGAFTLIGSNFTDAPVYPIADPGIRFSIAPTSKFYAKAAVFGMDSNSDPAGNNANGTHFHINPSDGALFITELGYLVNQSPNDRGLQGTYKIGSFIQHGNYTTWNSQAKDALGTGSLSSHGTNYAVYAVGDQQVYVSGGKSVSVFARAGFAPTRYSFVDRYLDAGFNFTGFVPGRALDVAGVAVAFSGVSTSFSDSQELQGNGRFSSETVIEATYKINIAPWWSIQPDFQYIINPSGADNSTDAVVLGVRTSVTF